MSKKRVVSRFESLELVSIRINGGTQPRCEIDQALVAEYAADIEAGVELPPVVVFQDGTDTWLADGFHRFHGHAKAGKKSIATECYPGTLRDAILYSVGANASHGKRRTNADKRKAVETLLKDEEWSAWSDGVIASRCLVSDRFVAKVREELTPNRSESTGERKGADGRTINTANIGKRAEPAPDSDLVHRGPPAEIVPIPPGPADPPEPVPLAIDFPADVYPSEEDEEAVEPSPETPPGTLASLEFAKQYRALGRQVTTIQKALADLGANPACNAFHELSIDASLKTAHHAIKFAVPYAVCPYCKGHGCRPKKPGDKTPCRGSGYVNETIYKQAPVELRQ